MLIKNSITTLAVVTAIAVCFATAQARAASPCYYGSFIYAAITKGVNENGSYSPEVVEGLRRSGYRAMDDMRAQFKDCEKRLAEIASQTSDTKPTEAQQLEQLELTNSRDRLAILIDAVARQRGATTSGLLWHTNLDEAIKEAKETDKPILSLRMLGNLTDEYSCANSRFFRTTLYSNQAISKQLRKDFVLHWKSVRPVPKITVDFGDGRTLERTITGNSAHYLLDKNGQPLDCLPGLYGPGEFTGWLGKMVGLNNVYKNLKPAAKADHLKTYHNFQNLLASTKLGQAMNEVDPSFAAKVSKPQTTLINNVESKGLKIGNRSGKVAKNTLSVDARLAAPIAFSKSIIEAPILNLAFDQISIESFEREMNDAKWAKLAQLHAGVERLDESSIAVIKRENPSATQASLATRAKRRTEDNLTTLVESFERSILIDTVRNEYLLHRQIHNWFANKVPTDVEVLNQRVYAELFLTPDTDPWLGLKPENVYTALDNDGVTIAAKD